MDHQPAPTATTTAVVSGVTPVGERTHPVHWFTGRLAEVLDDLLGPDGQAGLALSLLGPEETAEAVVEVDREVARLQGLLGSLLAHAEIIEVSSHATPVATTTPSWFAHATCTPATAAARTVKHALRMASERAATGAALRAGACDAAQAAVVVNAVDALPEEVPAAVRAQAEAHLLDLALRHDAVELKKLAAHLHEVIDPDGADAALAARLAKEEEAATADATVTIRNHGKGRTLCTIDVPAQHGDRFRTVLDAYANPTRPCHRDESGADGAGEPGPLDGRRRRDGGWVDDATAKGRKVTRDRARGRAFLELLENLPLDKAPSSGGLPPVNVVTMSLETLLGGLAPGVMDTGTLISPGEARRLAAAHGVIPVVLGTKSEVLDVGAKARFHTRAMRVALRVQHPTCTVDGCTIPAAWCHAHHQKPWALHKQTNLRDATLLCGPHHRMVHNPAYKTTYDPGGTTHLTRIRR